MRTENRFVRAVAVALTGATLFAAAAHAASQPTTTEEYEQRIQQLENAVKELRKDSRQLQVAEEEKAKLKPLAGYDNGFFIQSADGANKLSVGGYVHFDGRYFTTNGDSGTSQFLFRRARLDVRGKLFKYYEFKLLTDFAGGQSVIQDAYLNLNYVPWLRLQAGKYKSPTGLERLQSANALMLIERAFPTQLVPNRDLGFMAHGQPFYGAVEYQLAIMNGAVDGGSFNNDIDFNDDKMFAGRLFFLPLKDGPWTFARGLGVGVAGTYGRNKGTNAAPQLPAYRSDGQQVFFSYVNTPASGGNPAQIAIADGPVSRIAPQGYWYWGPAGFMWEWTQSQNDVQLGTVQDSITATAWQTQLSYVVTGENNTFRGTTPAKNFDPWKFFDGHWGALEVAARYSELEVEKDVYTLGFANPARSARKARAWAIGANWVMNKMVRLMLDFDRTTFEGGAANNGDRPAENVIMSRVQFVF